MTTPLVPPPAPPRMRSWWVRFSSGAGICVWAVDAAAAEAMARPYGERSHRAVHSVKELPYPATPQLNPEAGTGCPAFCYRPSECAGKTYCDGRPACTE